MRDYDTWHAGRFISKWASKESGEALMQCFCRFKQTDSWQALVETSELFKKLSIEVADQLNYERPSDLEAYVTKWLIEKHMG